MRRLRHSIIVGLLVLTGCNTIEHRSETITKEPLTPIQEPRIKPLELWSNSKSSGVGNSDAKLSVAVSGSSVVVADYKGKLFALNKQTGRLIWQAATKKMITAGPSIVGDRVFVGTADGFILAYQFSDGHFLYQTDVTGAVLAAPRGNNDAIFVHASNGSLLSLNPLNGEIQWRFSMQTPPLMLRRHSSPVLWNNLVLVGFANGKLVALDRREGTLEWEKEIAISKGRSDIQRMVDISADPVIKDNIVYAVSYQGQLAALEIQTGNSLWQKDFSSNTGIVVAKKALFLTDPRGEIWSLNRNSGKEIWKQKGLTGRELTAPVIWNDYVIVGDSDGYLHWVSQQDGSFLGRVKLDSKGLEASPVIVDDVIYVLGRSGKVFALKGLLSQQLSKGG